MPPKQIAPNPQILSKKDATTFTKVMTLYEKKDYRRALKLSDGILKTTPTHGETLCMRGLILNYMSRKPEAHEHCKKGLMFNMKSHVCWHVYGLVHRSDRNYVEAIKCYKQALKIDEGNMQILRDLSLLQIQMRDLTGFNGTRNSILNLKANQKFHWIAFAMSYHLLGQYTEAINVIDTFHTQDVPAEGNAREAGFSKSELVMYKTMIMRERGTGLSNVLTYLTDNADDVLDTGAYHQEKGSLELVLGQHSDARETFEKLFGYGVTEDYRAHCGYMCAVMEVDATVWNKVETLKGTDTVVTVREFGAGEREKLIDAYKALAEKYPRSAVVKRCMVTMLEGEEQVAAVREYVKKGVKKGVPSLGSDLAALYVTKGTDLTAVRCSDPVDVVANASYQMVKKVATEFIKNLEEKKEFSAGDSACYKEGVVGYRGEKESDETLKDILVWTRYLMVQLLELAGEYEKALTLLETCIGVFVEGDTEAIDLYERKARLIKLSGDVQGAATIADDARKVDTADRYINNKTTKYLLRAGKYEQAEKTIGMFTRHEANPNTNLFEMQCSWYELEYARCMMLGEDRGKALKKFVAVEKHFDDFADDQFDFHTYCIRKMTLRAYVNVLRLEDHIWGHKYFRRAAEGAIKIYLYFIDNPMPKEDEEPDYSTMTSSQKKSAKAALRKKKNKAEAMKKEIEEAKKKAVEEAAKRAAEEEAEDEKEEKSGEKKKKKASPPVAAVDEDPDGLVLLNKDAVVEATRYANSLKLHAPNDINTWVLNFDVAMKRGKWMLGLQALYKGVNCSGGSSSPDVFERTVRFAQMLAKGACPFETELLRGVAVELCDTLLSGVSAADFVRKTKGEKAGESLAWRCALARSAVVVGGDGAAAAKEIVDGGVDGVRGGHKVVVCVEVASCVKELGGEALESAWKVLCRAKFPRATVF